MTWRFSILGPLAVFEDQRSLPLGAPKQRAVLATLLLERGRAVSRDALIDAVWGQSPPASAAGALQVYVHGLRQVLGPQRIETLGTSYRLALDEDELDAARFDTLLEQARRALAAHDALAATRDASTALGLWRGPALADLPRDMPVAALAATLEERRLEAIELRNDAELALGRHDGLAAELPALVAAHPFRERLREQQIVALYRSGRQDEALAAYRAARRVFVEELGIEPGPRLRELEAAILRQDAELAPRPASADAAPPIALPAPPTPLIGRDAELTEAETLFAGEQARLVTLTGPGGVGKTRLAMAIAERIAPGFADGVVWVDLAPVRDPALLAQTLADALGLDEHPQGAREAVAAHLSARSMLVVLDNFEQLSAAAADVAALLTAARGLRLLVTSRSALGVRAENELLIPPLALPAVTDSLERVAASEAVRLFVARARAADRGFALDAELAPVVAGICRRLDGLPLAIELAAARLRGIGPRELGGALESRLATLIGGPVDLPSRQRTLRATLDWSHDALTEPERRAFAWLGVFAGSGSRDAIVAVCGPESREPLGALVAASLVRRLDGGAEERLGMLETIREYALERLGARGETDEARERHARQFLALAEHGRDMILTGRAGQEIYAALDRDHDNLRAALDWAADAGALELEVRLACALRQFWLVRGHIAEGRRFFERAVENTEGRERRLRAEALMHGGPFAHRQGALDQARAWWEEALTLLRELGDDAGVARCAGELGAVAYSAGDLERAAAASNESAAAFAALGDDMRVAIVEANLGEIELARGNLDAATRHCEQAVAIQRSLEDHDQLATTLHGLARVRVRAGRDAEARELMRESLQLAAEIGYREVIAELLADVARLALAEGRPDRAAMLAAAARATRLEIGVRLGDEHAEAAELHRQLREQLGAEALAAIERQAGEGGLGAAVQEALRALE